MSTEKERIAAFREALGASSDAKLAERLGISRAAVNKWYDRGVPKGIESEVAEIARQDRLKREKLAVFQSNGPEVVGKGLCLAIWLAPSLDAVKSRRFDTLNFGALVDTYAAYFEEIHLACIEQVASRMKERQISAAEAFVSLARDEPKALYAHVFDRALRWRNGDP